MKVDGGISGGIGAGGSSAAELERAGYDGAWSAETNHDPFLPLLDDDVTAAGEVA